MSEAGAGQEGNNLQRFWWLGVLLALIFLLLCVFVGPGKGLLSPVVTTEPPPTEKVTQPPTDKPTEVATEVPTDKPAPTEEATEKPEPTEKPTEKPTEIVTLAPTEVVFIPTEPVCSADPSDGVCAVECGENQDTDPACGEPPKCGSDCSATGYCGDGSNGLFCDNGTCNGVRCEPKQPKKCSDPNQSKRCCEAAGGDWDGECYLEQK